MAGKSICPETGSVVNGINGKYLIRNYLGGGGNGKVYAVDVIEERGLPKQRSGYAIKVFDIAPKNEDDPEYIKRQTRFIKEIKKVLSFQDEVGFIIHPQLFSNHIRLLIKVIMPDEYCPVRFRQSTQGLLERRI